MQQKNISHLIWKITETMLVSSEKLSSDWHTQNWFAEERDYKRILHMA